MTFESFKASLKLLTSASPTLLQQLQSWKAKLFISGSNFIIRFMEPKSNTNCVKSRWLYPCLLKSVPSSYYPLINYVRRSFHEMVKHFFKRFITCVWSFLDTSCYWVTYMFYRALSSRACFLSINKYNIHSKYHQTCVLKLLNLSLSFELGNWEKKNIWMFCWRYNVLPSLKNIYLPIKNNKIVNL